jgi:hypothetical protein
MLIQKKKIKNCREETKIDSEIEKKKVKNDFWGLVIFCCCNVLKNCTMGGLQKYINAYLPKPK